VGCAERDARAGARCEFNARVQGIRPWQGGWQVEIEGARSLRCRRLIVCPGGLSHPRMGTTGDGYRWLAELGLPVVPPVPALVPLSSPAAWVHELAGVALQDVEARLVDAHTRVLGRRRRPVLFTHRGLSGPAAMDLSVTWRARWRRKRCEPAPRFTLELISFRPRAAASI
jgi:predicted flavoprotein YhiN